MSARVGDFLCHEEIGRGSTSKVFRGQCVESGEIVALKRINKNRLGVVLLKRITDEIQLLERMSHTNILKYRACVDTKKYLYLVSEFCNGGDLDVFLQQTGVLSQLEAKFYICQIRDSLRYLKELGIVHRDLKPHNLLLHFNKQRTSVHYDYRSITIKLADFGLAKEITNVDLKSTICGSPLFAGPEILLDGRVHERSDLWSLGVILYKMVFGVYPFGEPTSLVELGHVLRTWVLHFPRNIPCCIHLRDLLERLLQKIPEDRCDWDFFFDHPYLDCDGEHCHPEVFNEDTTSSDDECTTEADTRLEQHPSIIEDYCDRSSIIASTPLLIPGHRTIYASRITPDSFIGSLSKIVTKYISM